ncbi:MAG: hypothetical protein J6S63_05020 [Atopobiaceae bacterium]|nr:hypothetical protein [Atopobiaceae bacterium]
MSLFNKKRSVMALGDDALASIKQELHSILGIASSYDKLLSGTDTMVISLEGRVRADLLAFLLYLNGVGKNKIDLREIEVVNQIFDIDLSHVDFTLFRNDVGDEEFENAVPPSILLFSEMGKVVQREQFRKRDGSVGPQGDSDELSALFVNGLINLYALIGSAFISADGRISERESGDLIRYLCMMNRAVNGLGAPLPAGAAQRTLDAHVRLFGKPPKR